MKLTVVSSSVMTRFREESADVLAQNCSLFQEWPTPTAFMCS